MVLLNTSNANQKLDFTETHKLANIALSNKSLLDSSGLARSGNIFVAGNNVSFSKGSIILNQNVSNYKPNIFLEARGDISFQGSAFNNAIPSSIRSEALGFFEGANIQVSSQNLTLQNNAQIASQTFASGKGGNVSISVSKNVLLNGKLSSASSIITSITSSTFGQGKAGNIDINAQNINIINGATISSGTFNTGDSGSIFLNALDTINISQREPLNNLQSIVSSSSFNHGNAGILSLNAKKIVINEGRIDSSTLGQGNSGSIFLNASESISIRGSEGNKDSPSGVIASADIADDSIRNLLENLIDLPSTPSGNSGSIEIQSPLLTLENNSTIQINNDGIGDGGSLRVNSNKIDLDNFSTLNASTKSGQGGNIFLNSETVIFSDSSGITSNSEGIGNGGNIYIDSNNLIVLSDSFILANAFEGNGGNISIISPNVFISSDSRVTSSSVLGIDGTVNFSSPPISFFPQAASTANITSEANVNIVYGCLAVPSQALSTLKIVQVEANNNNTLLSLPLISIDKISDRSHIPSASILVQDSNGKSWAASLVPSSLCNTQSN